MFLWIIIFLVILLLLLGVGMGIGFLLQWLFPEMNIGIAILIGLISTGIRTAAADGRRCGHFIFAYVYSTASGRWKRMRLEKYGTFRSAGVNAGKSPGRRDEVCSL